MKRYTALVVGLRLENSKNEDCLLKGVNSLVLTSVTDNSGFSADGNAIKQNLGSYWETMIQTQESEEFQGINLKFEGTNCVNCVEGEKLRSFVRTDMSSSVSLPQGCWLQFPLSVALRVADGQRLGLVRDRMVWPCTRKGLVSCYHYVSVLLILRKPWRIWSLSGIWTRLSFKCFQLILERRQGLGNLVIHAVKYGSVTNGF